MMVLHSSYHQDVSGGEFLSTEELATSRRRDNLAVEEREVGCVVVVQEHGVNTSSDGSGDWLDEEWHRGIADFCFEGQTTWPLR